MSVRGIVFAAFLASALTARSWAQEPAWESQPSADEISRAYPVLAASLAMSGEAILKCTALVDGRIGNCIATSAKPSGFGFDDAALILAKSYKLRTPPVSSDATGGGEIRVPVQFAIPEIKGDPLPPPTSDRALSLAKEMLTARGALELKLDQSRDAMVRAFSKAISAEPDARKRSNAEAAFKRAVAEESPTWIDTVARVHAAFESEAALEENLSFSKTAAGQRYSLFLPRIGAAYAELTPIALSAIPIRMLCEAGQCSSKQQLDVRAIEDQLINVATTNVSAERLSLAREAVFLDNSMVGARATILQHSPADPRFREAFERAVDTELGLLARALAGIYADAFDLKSLRTIVDFKRSPGGRELRAHSGELEQALKRQEDLLRRRIAQRAQQLFCEQSGCS